MQQEVINIELEDIVKTVKECDKLTNLSDKVIPNTSPCSFNRAMHSCGRDN